MKEATLLSTNQPLELPGTIYVHLCSGEVQQIEDVEEITITNEHIVFTRGELAAVILERRVVYYTCSQPGEAPSAY